MPSLKSNKNLLGLPQNTEPLGTRCLTVFVPDDPEWISLFTGALYRLGQQVWYDRDPEHKAKIVADRWKQVYLDLMNRMRTSNPCEAVDMFDVRQNPTNACELQKTTDGVTWVTFAEIDNCVKNTVKRNPTTGEYGYYDGIGFHRFPDGEWVDNPPEWTFPEPKTRTGTDEEKRCIAAASAARVLQALYRETWGWFINLANETAIGISQAMTLFAEEVLKGTGAIASGMIENAQNLMNEQGGFQDLGFPDSLLEQTQNILYCAATVTDNRVYFNKAQVISEFGAIGTTPYPGLISLINWFIGEDGLNAAGNIVAVSDADCSNAPCGDQWCYEWDFTVSDGGWELADPVYGGFAMGEYVAGQGWTAINGRTGATSYSRIISIKREFAAQITRVEMDFDLVKSGFTASSTQLWNITSDETALAGGSAGQTASGFHEKAWDGDRAQITETSFMVRSSNTSNGTYGGSAIIRRARIYGTGVNPFGEDNCA